MIEIMATGKVIKPFQERVSSNGNPFAIGHILAMSQQRTRQVLSCICFDSEAIDTLLKLSAHDSICIIGDGTPKYYTDAQGEVKTGIDVLVKQVMTIYQINKKKKAIKNTSKDEEVYMPTKKDVEEQSIPSENGNIELISDDIF